MILRGKGLRSIRPRERVQRRPKLLTKAQYRLPWNNPLWGGNISCTPKAELQLLRAGIVRPSEPRSTSNVIKEKKKVLSRVQTIVQEKSSHYVALRPKVKVSELTRVEKRRVRVSQESKPFSEWFQYLQEHPEALGNTCHVPGEPSDISICTLNVNSLSAPKLSCILAAMMTMSMDVMVLTDTRHRESTCKSYTALVKRPLGPHAKCIHSAIAPHTTRKGSTVSSVGGQMIILTQSWTGALNHHFQDPINLGSVSGIC